MREMGLLTVPPKPSPMEKVAGASLTDEVRYLSMIVPFPAYYPPGVILNPYGW